MTHLWTVKNGNGEVLSHFTSASPLEVGRKLVPGRYDAFRLQVSSSYRELFERAVNQILKDLDLMIVRLPSESAPGTVTQHDACVPRSPSRTIGLRVAIGEQK
jgi:hypothetical protein